MSTQLNIQTRHWLDQLHTEGESLSIAAGQAVVYSCRSPEKESSNEDGAILISIDSERAVLAVVDGCGGMNGGDVAAKITTETLSREVEKALKRGSGIRAAVLDGIEKANSKVVALATGAAATLAVAEIREGKIRPYHVGDSQILLVGNRGKLKLQTCAHSPVGFAVESGMLSEAEAMHHEERHIVSNVVGARDCRIEMGSRRKMSPRDTLLIGSDGVFDNLQLDEIAELIRKGPLPDAARNLVAQVSQRMTGADPNHPSKADDVTFILFRLTATADSNDSTRAKATR